MPELPEVELTRRRLERDITGKQVQQVLVRAPKLRLPVPPELEEALKGRTVRAVERRGKYLLLECEAGWLIVHLGMTGFLRLLHTPQLPGKHDHVDIVFTDGSVLRFHDPRKFGTIAWTTDSLDKHPLLAGIGPEPLTAAFSGAYLFRVSRTRRVVVKLLIMNMAIVAGVGNIYANEALFRAGIRPDRAASSLSRTECERLAVTIREVLQESIDLGSTYRVEEGTVTYHPLAFDVYGRGHGTCTSCGGALEAVRLGNRSTVFCPRCQQ
ncbi:bifunctional DNA-formamidopyrimidine glycosylase/DNA-(apurinic or apyrimidinic site) lyase [Pelobacter propionicus]|uniref:Formamidopyrimidine-DNA glycosylase n=1 Tax=Pelobacter propionicus (strain DSM 2379 / NBRC 103807 / OttBd1) TaxID=338966 RepID=FPG_PELPD|nr:bifunctional DNA-formamidopyrimidine glycosylase/DNA-(apurinic or apyrimidinic site) lyase [Pelobacter propionicus]A1AV29.1 RecName: Full=Formamidopyrimidine-DNA glycosylase; Short=Fapy-DNA glycosylase; AltName: Full=DNA-(apurinic or apyrimidinic site) lyase MutM; Short=AP lyase MutM [Pelobacter propionicus DSM 2379]ABL01200.1 DNA-(apurinic or apyrimidinic site) lyase / Formamidopyrimidine-DNA glycosylase [Pelobacter propionicus DSM 2379]